MNTMGQEVRRRRRELHLNQEEVADLAGVSPSLVRFIEHNKPTLRLDKVANVLNVLGLEIVVKVKSK
ncbi:MAG TPA: helix-turn-helix domain-containing protein [Acidimicrobiales bacterium]|nr:helix-turn-helix domain-containing protein [Acidimicrobiales bacterium]